MLYQKRVKYVKLKNESVRTVGSTGNIANQVNGTGTMILNGFNQVGGAVTGNIKDVKIISKQNTSTTDGESVNGSVGIPIMGGGAVTGSVGFSTTTGDRAYVDTPSSLIVGAGSNLTIGNGTNIGGVVGTTDGGSMVIKNYYGEDIENHDTYNTTGASIGLITPTSGASGLNGITGFGVQYQDKDKEGTTHNTVIGNVSIGNATGDEINRDETKVQETTKNTDTGAIDVYVEGGVLDLLTKDGRKDFATNIKLAGDEVKEKIDIINRFIEKLNSETGSNITLIENKFESPIAAPTIKKVKDSNGNETEVISIGNGMTISDPDLVAELKALNKKISDDFIAGKYDNILDTLKNNKIITKEEYSNLKTGDTETFANMPIEEKVRVLFMSEGLGLYDSYQKMSDGEDKKKMAAKLEGSFGIKIGDNEAKVLDSLFKAKISENLSYEYKIDETHSYLYSEKLNFENADSNLYKYSLETYTFSENLQKLIYSGQKIFSERMKTELLYEKDGKKIYYKDLLDKSSPYFKSGFLSVEEREEISIKVNRISNEIANQLYGTNSKMSVVGFDTIFLRNKDIGGVETNKSYYPKEKFEEGLANGSNFYNSEGIKINDYNELPDEFIIQVKLGENSPDETIKKIESTYFNMGSDFQTSVDQHECGITGHCKQNSKNMGQKISELEMIWIKNYNGSYYQKQDGEDVYYYLQPKEQISYVTQAFHAFFNASKYPNAATYNYERFKLKVQELQKEYGE